jgi:hypothetical protein
MGALVEVTPSQQSLFMVPVYHKVCWVSRFWDSWVYFALGASHLPASLTGLIEGHWDASRWHPWQCGSLSQAAAAVAAFGKICPQHETHPVVSLPCVVGCKGGDDRGVAVSQSSEKMYK